MYGSLLSFKTTVSSSYILSDVIMDQTFDASDKVQESNMAAKQRFESFKMGGGASTNSLNSYIPKHSHGRSRSRNSSISSLSTLSISASAPSFPSPVEFSSNNVPSNAPPSKRPNSHHRRRSSVSTRRESAELMGVSLPDLPAANSDDNVNLGDRDSIRRRALWALEGKPDLAFSKVEIPDITSPDLTKSFEFPTKPSFPPGTGISGHGISSLMNKRDSFGKMFPSTSTSKDQLQTLIEEEEEEEESQEERPAQVTEVVEEFTEAPTVPLVAPASTVTRSTPRHRPASLNLKPLSLVSGNAVSCAPGNLPTPTLTPNHRPNGLRSLALTSGSDISLTNAKLKKNSTNRHSTTVTPSSSSSFSLSSRRSFSSESSSVCDTSKKRSSISYKCSVAPVLRDIGVLPTPDSTPTDRRFSELNDVECVAEQPLTTTEQHFLFRSHNVLLARIMDLERTLRSRSMSRSRPLSMASEASAASSEPSDEMLQLIADLKTERDELKRDVDGWRMRVADADKQAGVLARRIEAERREAWVARSRLGLLEVEKRGLDKALSSKNAELQQSISQSEQFKKECDGMREELDRLRARLRDADNAVDEVIRLRAALEQERARRAELEKVLDDAGLLNTPTIPVSVGGQDKGSNRSYGARPHGLNFQSIDSDSSSTDVESVDHNFTKAELTLDAVTEEDEDEDEDSYNFSDGDELAGYEDAEDSDLSFQSPDGSSIGSGDELDIIPVSVLNEATNRLSSSSKPAPSKSSHARRNSLSKTWTFPKGQPVTAKRDVDEVDRFFGCLDDVENSPPFDSEDMGKAMFTSTFSLSYDDDEELPPFVIPSDVGTVVDLLTSRSLEVVPEEDEDYEGEADEKNDGEPLGEEVEGGIRFTFNPPPTVCSPPPVICITPPTESEPASVARKPVPIYEPFDDEEDDAFFTFPQSRVQEPITPPSSSPPTSESSSRPSSRTSSSPSSIPRATSLRSFMPLTPPRSASGHFNALADYPATSFVTPPSRRGGTTPSFIPQPVSSSPSKIFSPSKSRVPVQLMHSEGAANANGATLRCYGTSEEIVEAKSYSSDTCEYPDQYASTSSLSSIMSSPLAARFSFQTLSNFIPLSWTPGAAAVASHTTPNTSVNSMDDVAEAASPFTSDYPGIRRSTERRFISRDQQLEKLKNRLGNNHIDGIGRCLAVAPCGACKGADIFM